MDKNMEQKSTLKQLRISPDWTISDIFKRFPDKIDELSEVLTDYGLHCVGCNANQFETIEQGCEGHGFDEEIISSMIDDLNKVVAKESNNEGDLVITKSALSKLSGILSRKSKELDKRIYLRINYNSGEDTCCKNLYTLAFEGNPHKDNDVLVDTSNDDVKVVLKKSDMNNFSDLILDYDDEQKGFKIEKTTDGCGTGGCSCSH